MAVRTPTRKLRLGDPMPPFPFPVTRWKWPATPALTAWSEAQLKYPLGTIITDVVDGHPIVARIETHDAYGAHPEWAPKPHKGTSTYALADDSGLAIAAPPLAWGSPGVPDASFAGEQATLRKEAKFLLAGAGLLFGAVMLGPVGLLAGLAAGLSANWLIWGSKD